MTKRHNGRIIAILALYNMDLNKLSTEETIDVLNNIVEMESEEEYPVEIDVQYAKYLVCGTMEKLAQIDSLISKNLVNYTIDRLSYVDRAIVRVAVDEMLTKKLDKSIIINEAIEITKIYSSLDDDKQSKFNNSLLDNIAKELYE